MDIQIFKDGRNYRQAHIEFETKKDLINAMNMKNKSIKGRMIFMSLYNDRGSGGGGLFFFDNFFVTNKYFYL